MASVISLSSHENYFVIVVLILIALFLIICFEDKIRVAKPGLAPAIDTVANILMLLVVLILRNVLIDCIHSTIITVIHIGLCFSVLLSVSNLIVIIGPYCLRKTITLMQELHSKATFFLVRIGAKRPEGYVIFSYRTDEEMGFCSGVCAICLMEYEKREKCALLDKCGHTFHHICLHECLVFSTRCPLCRQSIKDCTKE